MSETPQDPVQPRRWFSMALGPALFLLVELLFRPELQLSEELIAAYPSASPVLVRHALASTLWIAAWWFTEAIPIPATSLLPLVLFPALGLGESRDVARQYGHELMFLFIGGLLLAMAMERTGLHRRVALRIVRCFGSSRRALVLGFMVATATVSMWISNTATTMLLLPVALAVLSTTEDDEGCGVDGAFPVALLLGIAYAANIGGLGTPIGSPTNLIFQSVYHEKTGVEVSFVRWMGYGLPLVVVLLPLTWLYLVRGFARGSGSAIDLPRFGPMTRDQRWVTVVFSLTALAWVTRGGFGDLPGWGPRLAEHGVRLTDSTVAVTAALVLFLVPSRSTGRILDWRVAPRLPWGVLLLLGAGFAISQAFDTSGLTLWIGTQIESFGELDWNPTVLLLALLVTVVGVSIAITEFASNVASASILLPILFGVSVALGPERFPPDLLMVSAALACTTGFAMPAGTPPNALVFATERISILRFARTGIAIDLLSLVLIVAMMMARHLLA